MASKGTLVIYRTARDLALYREWEDKDGKHWYLLDVARYNNYARDRQWRRQGAQ